MKRGVIFIKIFVIILLSLFLAFLFTNGFYFTSIFFFLIIILIAYSLYVDQQKVIKRIRHMISSIHYGELNLSFNSASKGEEQDLEREMNEALAVFQSRLRNSVVIETENNAWQKLVQVMTHEIMNSVAPIISLSETITERNIQEEMNEKNYQIMLKSIQSIHRRSKGLVDFVENYHKLTKIPAPIIQPVSVSELFNSIEHLFLSKKVAIHFYVIPLDLTIYADKSLIEQALINLLKNAVEACEDLSDKEVLINAFRKNGISVITVSDNGKGILPETLDKIFIPFYTTKPKGSGIGLSFCRQVINRHGGSISVISGGKNKGAIFTISFPFRHI
ncbi:MAG: HAMP domain-containing histidine kinase [Endomicrobium sp.]|jgi:signal transduction histidine kinase|nr:HAMP domain-containing histidine kinase [Endomicrobium sp.]